MPQFNPAYESLRGINDKYRHVTQAARDSRVPNYGDVRNSKREARARLLRDLSGMSEVQRQAEMTNPQRVEEIMDLLEGA